MVCSVTHRRARFNRLKRVQDQGYGQRSATESALKAASVLDPILTRWPAPDSRYTAPDSRYNRVV